MIIKQTSKIKNVHTSPCARLSWFNLKDLSKLVVFINVCIVSIPPLHTGHKLNTHKTFKRCPGRLLNVLCAFNLRFVSRGPSMIVLC